jgi:hypothetical protein
MTCGKSQQHSGGARLFADANENMTGVVSKAYRSKAPEQMTAQGPDG